MRISLFIQGVHKALEIGEFLFTKQNSLANCQWPMTIFHSDVEPLKILHLSPSTNILNENSNIETSI